VDKLDLACKNLNVLNINCSNINTETINDKPINESFPSDIYSQTGSIPRGCRDTWYLSESYSGAGFIGQCLDYLYTIGVATLQYSIDGGINWYTANLPSGLPLDFSIGSIIYNPNSNRFILTSGSTLETSRVLRSSDFQNWVVISSPPIIWTGGSQNGIFFNNLFIYQVVTDLKYIAYSPDGILWTLVSDTNNPYTFIKSDNMLVTVGSANCKYSTDGIIYNDCIGIEDKIFRAGCYNTDKQLFTVIDYTNGDTYNSADGITWTFISESIYSSVQTLLYVSKDQYNIPIQSYYFPINLPLPSDKFTVVFSSNMTTFGNIEMNGAVNCDGNIPLYYFGYVKTSDRFYLCLNKSSDALYTSTNNNRNGAVNSIAMAQLVNTIDCVTNKTELTIGLTNMRTLALSGVDLTDGTSLFLKINGIIYSIAITPVI